MLVSARGGRGGHLVKQLQIVVELVHARGGQLLILIYRLGWLGIILLLRGRPAAAAGAPPVARAARHPVVPVAVPTVAPTPTIVSLSSAIAATSSLLLRDGFHETRLHWVGQRVLPQLDEQLLNLLCP